ncbi:MAG: carotenoid oxygenase family protein [Myxococcota bacterium]|nr:carotenoid oxygenase family protein [Myxococcota bacterium]
MLEITTRYGKSLSASGLRPDLAPDWIDAIDNPYLHGLFAPITAETAAADLPVEGTLPADLRGAYFRNGPNSRFAPKNRYHWFDGDGMIHAVWFDGGRARYANRWIDTWGAAKEQDAGASIWPGVLGPFDFSLPGGPLKDTANTDLIVLNGRLMALWYESGRLVAIDPQTLATEGVSDFDGRLRQRISAHSKTDPATGDFIFFGYGDRPPYMRYGVVRPDGSIHHTDITLPGPRRPHDIGVTPDYSILHDFPVFFDPAFFKKTGKRVPIFHPDVPTRYGVIPRFGTDADVRWFEFEPCYMLHVVNTWQEGDEVVMIGCRNADPTLRPDRRDGRIAAMLSGIKLRANLHEWRMNLATGATSERSLDDLNAEFPMINGDWLGRKNRYTWLHHIPHEIPATFDALVRYDLTDGTTQRYDYGPGIFGSEAPFAPRIGSAAEDDGYVVSFVTDTADWSSSVLVLDAADISAGPIARVRLPQRVPAGFHAAWMPAEGVQAR